MSDELPAEEYHAEETEYTEQEETYEESPHDVEQQDGTAELQGEVTQNEGDGEYDENELGEDKNAAAAEAVYVCVHQCKAFMGRGEAKELTGRVHKTFLSVKG